MKKLTEEGAPALPPAESSKSAVTLATSVMALGAAALSGPAANAAVFNVTNLNDSGTGSLRQAIVDANNAAGSDVITFQSGLTGTITLTSGQLYVEDSVDIQGPGEAVISVNGGGSSRVFYIYNSDVTETVSISNLTVTNGAANIGAGVINFGQIVTLDHLTISNNAALAAGGGVHLSENGSLTITNCTITGNTAAKGAGIYLYSNGAPTTVSDTVISGNQAQGPGGGIYLYSMRYDVTLTRDTISNNVAFFAGGGIALYDTDGGTFTVDSSTLSGNSASAGGGGAAFYNPDDPIVIVNSTVSGNSADNGGGLYFYGPNDSVNISFTTISDNQAVNGGGIKIQNNSLTIDNSILANSTEAPQSSSTKNAVGDATADVDGDGTINVSYSLIEDVGDANLVQGSGNIIGQDPVLGPLANNGGPTETQLPQPGSPVIDAGDPAYAGTPPNDQRGEIRKAGANVDMGSVEVQPAIVVVTGTVQFSSATASVVENAGHIVLTITRTGGSTGELTVHYTTSNGTATAGQDYTAESADVTFADGETVKTIDIPITSDAVAEGPETFSVTLSNPSGGTLGPTVTVLVTITDPSDIPALGAWGKIMLTVFSGLAGMYAVTRKRFFSFFISALFLSAFAGSMLAAPATAHVRSQAHPHMHMGKANKVVGVVTGVETSGLNTIISLQGGTTVTIPTASIKTVDARNGRRTPATLAAIKVGQSLIVKTKLDAQGNVVATKVKLVPATVKP